MKMINDWNFAPASSKELFDIQADIECGFALKHVHEVHHSVVSSTDESFKDETRLLLLWVSSLVTLHTLCSTI